MRAHSKGGGYLTVLEDLRGVSPADIPIFTDRIEEVLHDGTEFVMLAEDEAGECEVAYSVGRDGPFYRVRSRSLDANGQFATLEAALRFGAKLPLDVNL